MLSKNKVYQDITSWEKIQLGRNQIQIISVVILSFVLRIINIGTESLWLDEVHTLNYVTQTYTTSEILFNLPLIDPHPPLYYLLIDLWISAFGKTELALRFPSAIFGSFAVLSVYLLGKELFNHHTGIFSALMTSLSSFHIYYSQSARMYSLLAFLSSISLYYMLTLLKNQENKFKNIKYIISTVLLCYTHVFGLFILLVQNVYFVSSIAFKWYNKDYKLSKKNKNVSKLISWLKIQSLVGLLASPWILVLIYRILGNGNGLSKITWISMPEPNNLIETLVSFLVLESLELPKYGIIDSGNALRTLSLIIMLVGILSIFIRVKENNIRFRPTQENILAGLILLTPILGAFVISYTVIPVLRSRYTIAASIGLYLLLGNFLNNIHRLNIPADLNKYIPLALGGIILLTLTAPLPTLYTDDQNEQWKEVSKDMESFTEPNDLIILSEELAILPYNHYYQQKGLDQQIRSIPEKNPYKDIKYLMRDHQSAWLILSFVDEKKFVNRVNSTQLYVYKKKEHQGIDIYKINRLNSNLPSNTTS